MPAAGTADAKVPQFSVVVAWQHALDILEDLGQPAADEVRRKLTPGLPRLAIVAN